MIVKDIKVHLSMRVSSCMPVFYSADTESAGNNTFSWRVRRRVCTDLSGGRSRSVSAAWLRLRQQKMAAPGPGTITFASSHQPQICLMHQGGGLQGLTRVLPSQFRRLLLCRWLGFGFRKRSVNLDYPWHSLV